MKKRAVPKNRTATKQAALPVASSAFDPYEIASDKLFEIVMTEAVSAGATAVHFEYARHGGVIRVRLGGRLVEARQLDRAVFSALLKQANVFFGFVEAGKLPQLNRIDFSLSGRQLHFNASLIPLDNFQSRLVVSINPEFSAKLADLSLNQHNSWLLSKYLASSHKATIVAAKSASRRKEWLFSLALQAALPGQKVFSIEQYVEQAVPAVEQLQLRPEIGFGAEAALRAVIAQDGDLVIVDEIRTSLELDLVLHLALAGKQVYFGLALEGLNDSFRFLRHLGSDTDLILAAIGAIVAVRQVRKLCPDCSRPARPSQAVIDSFSQELAVLPPMVAKRLSKLIQVDWELAEAPGCSRCQGSGSSGQEALSEVALFGKEIKKILKRTGKLNLADLIDTKNLVTLRQDAVLRAIEGKISPTEAMSFDKII